MTAANPVAHFDPPPETFRGYVIAGLIAGCEITDAEGANSYGPSIAEKWSRVRVEDRTAAVLATLVVDTAYRDVWMPLHTSAADWGYDRRVLHLVHRVFPAIARW